MADSMFVSLLNLPGGHAVGGVALGLGQPRQAFRKWCIVSTPGGVAESDEPDALRTLLCKYPRAAGPVYWSQTLLDLDQKSDATSKGFGNENPVPANYTAEGRAGDLRPTICVTVSKSSQVGLT